MLQSQGMSKEPTSKSKLIEHPPDSGAFLDSASNVLGTLGHGAAAIGRRAPGAVGLASGAVEVVKEIAHDMTANKPVERVVCGALAGGTKILSGTVATGALAVAAIESAPMLAAGGAVGLAVEGAALGMLVQEAVNFVADPAGEFVREGCHAAFSFFDERQGSPKQKPGPMLAAVDYYPADDLGLSAVHFGLAGGLSDRGRGAGEVNIPRAAASPTEFLRCEVAQEGDHQIYGMMAGAGGGVPQAQRIQSSSSRRRQLPVEDVRQVAAPSAMCGRGRVEPDHHVIKNDGEERMLGGVVDIVDGGAAAPLVVAEPVAVAHERVEDPRETELAGKVQELSREVNTRFDEISTLIATRAPLEHVHWS